MKTKKNTESKINLRIEQSNKIKKKKARTLKQGKKCLNKF